MHIRIVGGLDRNEGLYEEELARRAACGFESHSGHLAGRGAASLATLVERCDVVVVVTDVNSHAAVWKVRRLTKQRGSRFLLMSRCGHGTTARDFGKTRSTTATIGTSHKNKNWRGQRLLRNSGSSTSCFAELLLQLARGGPTVASIGT